MRYQKPQVEIIRFEDNSSFMTYSSIVPVPSYGSNAEAKAAAIAAMGWGQWDGVTAQKGADGKWMAYCTYVNGQTGWAGQYMCTSF